MINILIGFFIFMGLFSFYRSWRFMQSDAVGPDAVAIYAASEMLKRVGYKFTTLAAIIAFLQWIL